MQRFDARAADDLANAARIVWQAIRDLVRKQGEDGIEKIYNGALAAGWRAPFGDGALVLGRHSERKTLVLRTVLGPGVTDDE